MSVQLNSDIKISFLPSSEGKAGFWVVSWKDKYGVNKSVSCATESQAFQLKYKIDPKEIDKRLKEKVEAEIDSIKPLD